MPQCWVKGVIAPAEIDFRMTTEIPDGIGEAELIMLAWDHEVPYEVWLLRCDGQLVGTVRWLSTAAEERVYPLCIPPGWSLNLNAV
jgi:hypothetical protein